MGSTSIDFDVRPGVRLYRFRDAPTYCGMNKNLFNEAIRPYVPEIRIGKQGIAFDVHDLDVALDEYKKHNTVRGRRPFPIHEEKEEWVEKQQLDCKKEVERGTLINRSGDTDDFAKALEKVRSKKQRIT